MSPQALTETNPRVGPMKESSSATEQKATLGQDPELVAGALLEFLRAWEYEDESLRKIVQGKTKGVAELGRVVGDGRVLGGLLKEFGCRVAGGGMAEVRQVVGLGGENGGKSVVEVVERVLYLGVKQEGREKVVASVLGLKKATQKVLAAVIRKVSEVWNAGDFSSELRERVRELEGELEGAADVIGELRAEVHRLEGLNALMREREETVRREERDAGFEEGKMMNNEQILKLETEANEGRETVAALQRRIHTLEASVQEGLEREATFEEQLKHSNSLLQSRDQRVEELLRVGENLETQYLQREQAILFEKEVSRQLYEKVHELEDLLATASRENGSTLDPEAASEALKAQPEVETTSTVGSTTITGEGSAPSRPSRVADELDLAADKSNVNVVELVPPSPPRDYNQPGGSTESCLQRRAKSSPAVTMPQTTEEFSDNEGSESEYSSIYSSQKGDGQTSEVKNRQDEPVPANSGAMESLLHQLQTTQERLCKTQEALQASESERSELGANYSVLVKEVDDLHRQRGQLKQHEVEVLEEKERLIAVISAALDDKEKQLHRLRLELEKAAKLRQELIRERDECREDALRMEKMYTDVAREKDIEIIKLETQLNASQELARKLGECVNENAELKEMVGKTRESYAKELIANAQRDEAEEERIRSQARRQAEQEANELAEERAAAIVASSRQDRLTRRFSRRDSAASRSRCLGSEPGTSSARCSGFWKIFRRGSTRDDGEESLFSSQSERLFSRRRR